MAFGGELLTQDGESREKLAPALAQSLRNGAADAELPSIRGLTWVAVRVEAHDTLHYGADLELLPPLSELATVRLVAEGVRALHERGRVHGDLRPDTVRAGAHGAALVVPPSRVDATELLARRLAAGAVKPQELAFVAPELANGEAATAASDVYSLAALALFAATGRAPLGRVSDLGSLPPDIIHAALSQDPAARPTLAQLIAALEQPERASRRAPSLLTVVLALAGAFVFSGVLALALRHWEDAGAPLRLLALLAFTALTAAAGAGVKKLGFERSGSALQLLALELTWADAYYVLAIAGAERSYAAWALASASVGVIHCFVAARRRSLWVGALAALALSVALFSFGALLTSTLGTTAMLYALIATAIYAVLAGLGAQLGGRSLALPFLAGAGLWLVVACALSLLVFEEQSGGRAVLALALPYVVAPAAVFAARRLSSPYAAVVRGTGYGILLLAPALDLAVAWSEAAAIALVVVYALLHLGLLRHRGWARLSAALLGLSALVAAFSAGSRFASSSPSEAGFWLGLLVPYGAAVVLIASAWRARQHGATAAAGISEGGAAVLLAVAPSVHALLRYSSPYGAWLCITLGAGILVLARRLRVAPGWQWVAIVNLVLAPVLLVLWASLGHGGDELFVVAFDPGATVEWTRTRASYVATVLAAAAVLGRLAFTERPRGEARALEAATMVTFFFPVVVLSFSVLGDDLFYAALSLIGGGALLALGVFGRRALLAVGSAVALFLILSVQYFAKLSSAVPWSALALGFGLALFALGVLYEKKLKGLLPELGRWH